MSKIIAVANQKGGVGKTTTAISLAGAFVHFGKTCLLIDMDPQGNCGRGVGVDSTSLQKTITDVLVGSSDINKIIRKTQTPNIDLLPANLKLAMIESHIQGASQPFYLLKSALKNLNKNYDYIIIDCPPSLGLLCLNALCAANSVLIPVQCEYFALEAVAQILSTISKVQNKYNKNLEILGFLMTMYDARVRLATEVTSEIRGLFQEKTFNTEIPRNVSIAEAAARGKPIIFFRPTATGSQAYISLAKEILANE
ncbi:MAG: ParA family protein [Bacilli bacterium]